MHTVSVTIEKGEKTIQAEAEKNLHKAFSDQDIELPSGCLSGNCGACRIEVLEGELSEVEAKEAKTLDSVVRRLNDKWGEDLVSKKNIRLSCQANIIGPVKVQPI